MLKPGHPQAPRCDESFNRKLRIELRISRRKALAALRDEFRLAWSGHGREETKALEYGLVPELVRVANKEFRVAIGGTNIRLQDIDRGSDPADQRRRIEQIDDRPRWIGDVDLAFAREIVLSPNMARLSTVRTTKTVPRVLSRRVHVRRLLTLYTRLTLDSTITSAQLA